MNKRCCCATAAEIAEAINSGGSANLLTANYDVLNGADTLNIPAGAKSVSIGVISGNNATVEIDSSGTPLALFEGQTVTWDSFAGNLLNSEFDIVSTATDIVAVAWTV